MNALFRIAAVAAATLAIILGPLGLLHHGYDAPGVLTLRPVADRDPFSGAVLSDAVAGGPGLVAVGSIVRDGHRDPAVWTSPDGATWTAGPAVPAQDAAFLHLVAGGPGFVVAGGDCPPAGGECSSGTFWESSDAAGWTTPSLASQCVGMSCDVNALAAGPSQVIGVGITRSDNDPSFQPDGAVYLSGDGATWALLPAQSSLAKAIIATVVPVGTGFVAVGSHDDGGVAAWTSPDGATWTLGPDSPAMAGGEVRDLVATASGLVAVGRANGSAAVWTSADGTSWTHVPDSAVLKGAVMDAVAQVGSTLVSVGKDGSGAAAWTSPDGVTWTRLPDDPSFSGAEMTNVVATGNAVTAFGADRTGQVAIWSAALP